MSGQKWLIRNDFQLEQFVSNVRDLFAQHKRLVFSPPEMGAGRSLDQNALFHVWMREYAGHLTKTAPNLVPTGVIEGMKRHCKVMFYNETRANWIMTNIVNPKTGQSKKDVVSTKHLSKSHMFEFMEWIQASAANDGLILESKGEYQELLEKHLESIA